MTEDRKTKMLGKVRALLAKAEGTDFPEEADAFRQKADELMTAYAIEQWQVEAVQQGVSGRPMPERRDYDFSWHKGEFRHDFWALFVDLARHCRCKVMVNKINFKGEYTIPVLGLPSDLDYFDLLFTHLLLDFSKKVMPKPSPDLSYHENLAMLKASGLGWPEITRLMVEAGQLEYKVTHYPVNALGVSNEIRQPWKERKNYAKPAHDYRNWCKKTGTPQDYSDHRTYRRNFAQGYTHALSRRLLRMRRGQREAYDAGHAPGGMELVVRDIRQVINELAWEIWPDLRPHPPECECEGCHAKKCTNPKCKRPACVRKRKPVKWVRDTRKEDYAAFAAGNKAGQQARLDVHQGRRVGGNRKELS